MDTATAAGTAVTLSPLEAAINMFNLQGYYVLAQADKQPVAIAAFIERVSKVKRTLDLEDLRMARADMGARGAKYNYATMAGIYELVRDSIAEHGLQVTARITEIEARGNGGRASLNMEFTITDGTVIHIVPWVVDGNMQGQAGVQGLVTTAHRRFYEHYFAIPIDSKEEAGAPSRQRPQQRTPVQRSNNNGTPAREQSRERTRAPQQEPTHMTEGQAKAIASIMRRKSAEPNDDSPTEEYLAKVAPVLCASIGVAEPLPPENWSYAQAAEMLEVLQND